MVFNAVIVLSFSIPALAFARYWLSGFVDLIFLGGIIWLIIFHKRQGKLYAFSMPHKPVIEHNGLNTQRYSHIFG
jgi:hypothetical protein